MKTSLDRQQTLLSQLGRALRAEGYNFVTPTPESHRRVNARPHLQQGHTLRDVFGWSRPFQKDVLPGKILDLAERAGVLVPTSGGWSSTLRFSTLLSPAGEMMFVHSAHPTATADSVFFGPDSYRFASFLSRTVTTARRAIDIGCGAGVGGLVLAPRVGSVVLADINSRALSLAAVNIDLADRDGSTVTTIESDVLAQVEGEFDLAVANPPYLVDQAARVYRDGGGRLGTELACRIVREALLRLVPGGRLVLYSASPVVDGHYLLQEQLDPLLQSHGASWTWEELDPDVFGEELERPVYDQVERLAVMGLSASMPSLLASA